MQQLWTVRSLLLFTLFAQEHRLVSQTSDSTTQNLAPYRLRVTVDEVILTFHAADANGLPVNDLRLNEFTLLDQGKPPAKILDFQLMKDFPIRAGILMDTSESMEKTLPANRQTSITYAQRLLRQQTDKAFLMDFGRTSRVLQSWTGDPEALTASIRRVSTWGERRTAGTAIFDTLYRACLYQFGQIDHAASGNFILLFTDGEDNASSLPLDEAVNACQRTNTAVYAFRTDAESSFGSPGPKTLAELTSETGGRVFHDSGSEAGVYEALRIIEADLRNQYRLIYKPTELKHDGSFHHIALKAPARVDSIIVRSGYYAPKR